MQHVQLAAAQVVQQVLLNRRNLNKVMARALNNRASLAAPARAALQDLSFGTLRHYGRLDALLGLLLHKPLSDARLRHLLLVALYQLLMTRAAAHTVVDQAVNAARSLNPRASGLVNGVLRHFLRDSDALLQAVDADPDAVSNHPRWWRDLLCRQYGEQAAAILAAGNQHPPMTLRVNLRRSTPEQSLQALAEAGLLARQTGPEALLLDKPVPVERIPGFGEGLLSVQDAGAQWAAHLLNAAPGMRVLDACAAPGGKTAHVLERAEVDLTALDADPERLQRVAENLARLGLAAHLLTGDATRPEDWWDGQLYQRILADVPCSASGVVRRHPDIKWLRREADLGGFAATQGAILDALWPLLAPGGRLLYATCSVFRQENEEVIEAFLARQAGVCRQPVDLPEHRAGQLLPDDTHDGFFYALLLKTA